MLANIYPEPDHLEETIATLKFATRMMKVSNEAVINV
jgi:kinesin family protein 6/9